MTISKEKKVAWKLMGIEPRCRYCALYMRGLIEWRRNCKAFRAVHPTDRCDDFEPKVGKDD